MNKVCKKYNTFRNNKCLKSKKKRWAGIFMYYKPIQILIPTYKL